MTLQRRERVFSTEEQVRNAFGAPAAQDMRRTVRSSTRHRSENVGDRLNARLDALAAREDTWVTREDLQRYVDEEAWTEQSFVHDLERHAAERPEALAIVDEDGRRTTYGEYEQRTCRLARSLLELGLRRATGWPCSCPTPASFA